MLRWTSDPTKTPDFVVGQHLSYRQRLLCIFCQSARVLQRPCFPHLQVTWLELFMNHKIPAPSPFPEVDVAVELDVFLHHALLSQFF